MDRSPIARGAVGWQFRSSLLLRSERLVIDVSIVIPAYREEDNLRELLPRLNRVLERIATSFEVVVVDTESPLDQTKAVCKESSAIYLNRSGGNTYGDAVRC